MDGGALKLALDTAELEVYNQIRQAVQVGFVEDDSEYSKVHSALASNNKRVLVDLGFFYKISRQFATRVLNEPLTYLRPSQAALGDVARGIIPPDSTEGYVSVKDREKRYALKLGIQGWLASHVITPKKMAAKMANKLVCVEGIVTKCSPVQPDLTLGVYYIPSEERHFFEEGRSERLRISKPTSENEEKRTELEYGLSLYKDYQKLTIQEMPEAVKVGETPWTVDVLLEDDLAGQVKPGNRCRVYGVATANVASDSNSGLARYVVVGNNVEQLHTGVVPAEKFTNEMITLFKEIAAKPNTLDFLSECIAPAIAGHSRVKKGLMLQLVGGHAKKIEGDGTNLRGDIHILLIGDPSCGKSQMLRYMMGVSPLAVSTSGKGSSAVGLTAAVVSNKQSGQRRLEAGAMVKADGGLVCIDEFDKMGPADRVAIHEVMEQQTVTINKAGVFARLSARCSVLAAANPIYGSFDEKVDLSKQITFPDSLLSRFDLIYLIREMNSYESDKWLAAHVLTQHRAPPKESIASWDKKNNTDMFDSRNAPLQPTQGKGEAPCLWFKLPWSADAPDQKGRKKTDTYKRFLTRYCLSQFILYCKQNSHPKLSDEACERTAEFYAKLRSQLRSAGGSRPLARSAPTPRILEGCIRLATAHARIKMRSTVTEKDVAEAEKLICWTLFGEESLGSTSKKKSSASHVEEEQEEEAELIAVEIENLSLENRTERRKRGAGTLQPETEKKRRRDSSSSAVALAVAPEADKARVEQLSGAIAAIEARDGDQDWDTSTLLKLVNKVLTRDGSARFTQQDIGPALRSLQRMNKVMLVGERVYWI